MDSPRPAVFTPTHRGKRVRIPEQFRRFNEDRSIVTITPGRYPQIENGLDVATTPGVKFISLGGQYHHARAACGAGCFCSAKIWKVRT